MFKALIITTTDNEEFWIDNLDAIFTPFGLPVPEGTQPVLSMEFREAVCKYGITMLREVDDIRMNRFIPPYQIKYMMFYISKVPPKNQILYKILKGIT